MRIPFALLLLITLSSCASSSGGRKPNTTGAGNDGQVGQGGSAGRDGRAGTVIRAAGCEQYALQSAQAMHDAYSAKDWSGDEDSALTFMCGAKPKISAAVIEQIHGVFDSKIMNLLNSGYFSGSEIAIASAGLSRDLEGVKAKAKLMIPLFEELERNWKKEFGCLDGVAKSGGRDAGKMKVCFNSEIRYVDAEGKVETSVTMAAFRYLDDGSVDKYRMFEERASVYKLPVSCKNGAPAYAAKNEGSSRGETFLHTVSASCKQYASEYSAIYPSLILTY